MNYDVLDISTRSEFRSWLEENHGTAKECWIYARVHHPDPGGLLYLDAVEEALCFGWIDSTKSKDDTGRVVQRFTPRKKGSNWSELNKERCRRLDRLGLMTDAGRAVIPDLSEPFVIEDDILAELKADDTVWKNIRGFPELYVRIRVYNIQHFRDMPYFRSRLDKFIEMSRENVMYGEWNDGGRLL